MTRTALEPYDTALVLARVLTSGVMMSIERSDRELPALERLLTRQSGRSHAVLVNTRTAAIHAALVGCGIGHGDRISHPGLDALTERFLGWLGVSLDADGPAAFDEVTVRPGTAGSMAVALRGAGAPPRALVVDFSGLGFGPAAAMLTDDAMAWERAERLKIFGSYDLRTMWTQTAPDSGPVPGVQFNYRLSPLVAACVRLALTRASDASSETNARQ